MDFKERIAELEKRIAELEKRIAGIEKRVNNQHDIMRIHMDDHEKSVGELKSIVLSIKGLIYNETQQTL